MSTAALVSLQEYLTTTYRPDCDYVDGVLYERNVGQKEHSKLQAALIVWFYSRRAELRLAVFPEQRIQVGTRRYRIPDVCLDRICRSQKREFSGILHISALRFSRPTIRSSACRSASTTTSQWACRTFGCLIPRRAADGLSRARGTSKHSMACGRATVVCRCQSTELFALNA